MSITRELMYIKRDLELLDFYLSRTEHDIKLFPDLERDLNKQIDWYKQTVKMAQDSLRKVIEKIKKLEV